MKCVLLHYESSSDSVNDASLKINVDYHLYHIYTQEYGQFYYYSTQWTIKLFMWFVIFLLYYVYFYRFHYAYICTMRWYHFMLISRDGPVQKKCACVE